MAADDEDEVFEWVSSYSITHFDFPFLSFGHPTLGDEHAERRYSDTEWRRVAFKDGKIVGGVLIGDLSPQSNFKQLMREQRVVADQADVLMKKSVDLDELAPPRAKNSNAASELNRRTRLRTSLRPCGCFPPDGLPGA